MHSILNNFYTGATLLLQFFKNLHSSSRSLKLRKQRVIKNNIQLEQLISNSYSEKSRHKERKKIAVQKWWEKNILHPLSFTFPLTLLRSYHRYIANDFKLYAMLASGYCCRQNTLDWERLICSRVTFFILSLGWFEKSFQPFP